MHTDMTRITIEAERDDRWWRFSHAGHKGTMAYLHDSVTERIGYINLACMECGAQVLLSTADLRKITESPQEHLAFILLESHLLNQASSGLKVARSLLKDMGRKAEYEK